MSETMIEKINNNGHEFVDLGLPSGTKWASMNVGASKPSDAGLYFQWGDTIGYRAEQVGYNKLFNRRDYKWNPKGDVKTFRKYATEGAKLELRDDAAHVIMGGDWHIPSPTQIQELIDNTISKWAKQCGVSGRLFISKKDSSKFIFIPAAGIAWDDSVVDNGYYAYIWSSMLDEIYIRHGQCLYLDSHDANLSDGERYSGRFVRGVIG